MDVPWSFRILAILICGVMILRMIQARKGHSFFIRRIAGIDAIEESVGRATEVGRPIVFVPGIEKLDKMPTIAGLSVLRYVAKRCVDMMVKVLVPLMQPEVVSPAQEIIKDAYREAAREEDFNPNDVQFISQDEGAFAAGTVGMLSREQAAAGFYFGNFGFESLLISETGHRIGAIQVAATVDFIQVSFFICACDYVLIGEELYAASAYLSRDPIQVGALSGQDFGKLVLLSLIVAGTLMSLILMLSGNYQETINPVTGLLGR